MGGSDDPTNLVALTPEEHYVAHLLLVKMNPGNSKLIFAANMMSNRSNKSYGWIKRKFSEAIRIQNKNQQPTDEQRKKISLATKGKRKSDTWKSKIAQAHTKELEYQGRKYFGFDELKTLTGVSYHLYTKYYLNGIDPTPFINNPTHGMIKTAKLNPARGTLGKIWYNNGTLEQLFQPNTQPSTWYKGRLKNRNNQSNTQDGQAEVDADQMIKEDQNPTASPPADEENCDSCTI